MYEQLQTTGLFVNPDNGSEHMERVREAADWVLANYPKAMQRLAE